MAKNYGLLGLGIDTTDEDQQAAIRAGLLMGGLQMMMPVRGGRGKFAPQFAQGAMQGVGAYSEKLDALKRDRAARDMARRQAEAQQGLLSAFDYEQPDEALTSYSTAKQPAGLLDTGGLGESKKSGLLAAPQNYGEFNPRGRNVNTADMENDQREQMALAGMNVDDQFNVLDQEEMSNAHQAGVQTFPLRDETTDSLNVVKPGESYTPDAQGNITMEPMEVIGRRQQPTEPVPRQPMPPQAAMSMPMGGQTTPGINPGAPMRVNNGGPDPRLIQLYKRAQAAVAAGIPGAPEMLKSVIEQLNPSNRKTVTVGRTVIDPSTGGVIYQGQEDGYSLSPGQTRFEGGRQVASVPEKGPTPTELARLMQERDQLAQVNPNHPQLATYDRVITEYKQGGGVTVNTGNLGKPPTGFRWKEDGSGELEAIPGGPQDELGEAQKSQLIGVKNTRNAIKEYRDILPTLSNWDLLSPDRRSDIGLKYNNMLLQAKEAYRLGVINGPDYEILQKIVTNPLSMTGAITSSAALDRQAQELDRIMSNVEAQTGARRPQDANSGQNSSNIPPSLSANRKGSGFQAPADLPPGTRFRGYTPDGRRLWLIPGQDKPVVEN